MSCLRITSATRSATIRAWKLNRGQVFWTQRRRLLSSKATYKVDNPTLLVLGGASTLGRSLMAKFVGWNRISADFADCSEADFNVLLKQHSAWHENSENLAHRLNTLLKQHTPSGAPLEKLDAIVTAANSFDAGGQRFGVVLVSNSWLRSFAAWSADLRRGGSDVANDGAVGNGCVDNRADSACAWR